jgi:hypothetical protein
MTASSVVTDPDRVAIGSTSVEIGKASVAVDAGAHEAIINANARNKVMVRTVHLMFISS